MEQLHGRRLRRGGELRAARADDDDVLLGLVDAQRAERLVQSLFIHFHPSTYLPSIFTLTIVIHPYCILFRH